MSPRLHAALKSPRRLFLAIMVFIVLDLCVLLSNLLLSDMLAQDAVAINLAGRQRMLSQRMSKAVLLANGGMPGYARQQALQELAQSYQLFSSTLQAFTRGGVVAGGDSQPAELGRLQTADVRELVAQANDLSSPLAPHMATLVRTQQLSPVQLREVRDILVERNPRLLELMNQLTTALERNSVANANRLRHLQTGAFVLALFNFVVIVVGLVKQTQRVEHEGRVWRNAAQRDPLTGLFNRMAFTRRLEQALLTAKATKGVVAVFVLDLNGFKPINDTHGHAAGDAVLQTVAHALLSVARDTDTVARLGGDEFALFCPELREPHSQSDFCQRLHQRIELQQLDRGLPSSARASVGMAVYPFDAQDAASLLAVADTAMYHSKRWQASQMPEGQGLR